MKKITAVIPTLSNTTGLKHLLSELNQANIPAVVIDNAYKLRKTSPGVALDDSPGVVYLPQNKNLFFAAAVNLGAKLAQTEWLLIANDDIEQITTEKINRMIETAVRNNWIAVSPILVKPLRHPGKGSDNEHCPGSTNNQHQIENIGYKVLPIGKAELNFDTHKNTDKYIDGLTAACLLIKKEVFQTIGGFDESFIAYLEDVDLFLRLKKAGFHFGVDTDVKVIHNHMTTSSSMKGFKQKRDLINWIKLIQKNWELNKVALHTPGIIIERLRNLSGWVKAYL